MFHVIVVNGLTQIMECNIVLINLFVKYINIHWYGTLYVLFSFGCFNRAVLQAVLFSSSLWHYSKGQ